MALERRVAIRALAFAFAIIVSTSGAVCAAEAGTLGRATEGAVVVTASGPTTDGIGAGTIVAIDGGRVTVLTAKHVATFGALTLRFPDDSRAPARVLALVPGRDLALVVADVDPARAAMLHAAVIGRPVQHEAVHVWGSGHDGPAFETAATNDVGAALPDGDVRDRYTLACRLCHKGDSGAGVFDARGALVGIYVGYFALDDGPLSVAELPPDGATLVASGVDASSLARAPVPADLLAGGETVNAPQLS